MLAYRQPSHFVHYVKQCLWSDKFIIQVNQNTFINLECCRPLHSRLNVGSIPMTTYQVKLNLLFYTDVLTEIVTYQLVGITYKLDCTRGRCKLEPNFAWSPYILLVTAANVMPETCFLHLLTLWLWPFHLKNIPTPEFVSVNWQHWLIYTSASHDNKLFTLHNTSYSLIC